MSEKAQLRWFVLKIFLWMIPLFGIWVAADTFLNAPAFLAIKSILPASFSQWISGAEFHQSLLYVQTKYGETNGVVSLAGQAGNAIAYKIDSRIVTYALPFFAALTFATPEKGKIERLLWGLLAYYPMVIFCCICIALQNLVTILGPAYAQHSASRIFTPEAVAISYQLSVLILPVLIPVAVWWWQSRNSAMLAPLVATFSKDRADKNEDDAAEPG